MKRVLVKFELCTVDFGGVDGRSKFGFFGVLVFSRFFVRQRSYRVENLTARRSRRRQYFVRMDVAVEWGCLRGKRPFKVSKFTKLYVILSEYMLP